VVELKLGLRTVDLPFTIRIPDVTEAIFDKLVDEDSRAELLDGVMIVHSPATLRHDDVAGFIRFLKRYHAVQKGLGKILGPDSMIKVFPGFQPAETWLAEETVARCSGPGRRSAFAIDPRL
jgi:hypothetical protein